MDILGFIFGLIIFSALLGVAIVAVSIWGISKGVKAIANHVRGELPGRTARETTNASSRKDGAPVPPPSSSHANARARSNTRRTNPQRPKSYEYLDVDAGTTPERIAQVMRNYVDDAVVGVYAQDVIDALDSAEFRKRSLHAEIDSKFAEGSISWSRFANTADSALEAIVRNCALLANRVQAFDTAEYARLEQFFRSGGHSGDEASDRARLQRWKLLEDTRKEMDDIRATNEGLLLELGKLSAELGKLTSTASHDQSTQIAEEVSKLVDETKYYK